MKKLHLSFSIELIAEQVRVVGIIAGLTAVMLFIGRSVLGEAVVAMLYLLAVGWVTSRAGQWSGFSAALTAALMFDFFFIPPFFTFNVGSLEGWLMLFFFVFVAVVLVDRIQAGLALAQAREGEARLLYELSMALVGLRGPEDLARATAERLQHLYQAAQAQVTFFAEEQQPAVTASAPPDAGVTEKPDHVVPIVSARHMIGEISLWNGEVVIPAAAEHTLLSLAGQVTIALARMRSAQAAPVR